MSMTSDVQEYLVDHYGVTKRLAVELVKKHPEEIESAERWASRPYFPANKIADAESLVHLDPCAACEKESEADEDEETENE